MTQTHPSPIRPFSDRSCPKRSTGNRSRPFRLRSASPWLSATRRDRPLCHQGQVPAGVKLMPHRHPEDRVYTVLSGVFYIGLGDQFDSEKMQAYPPGSVVVLPGDTPHFHWAKSGEYVTQVTAIGPLGLEYLDPSDDPRRQKHRGTAARLLHKTRSAVFLPAAEPRLQIEVEETGS